MANDNNVFEYLIRAIADIGGIQLTDEQVKKLTEDIREQTEANKELAESQGEVNQGQGDMTQSMPQAWQGMEKYKNILGESSKAARHLHGNHRMMSHLFRMIGQQTCPELGEAMHALHMIHVFGGIGAVMGLVMAWQIWQKRVKELTEAMSEVKMPDLTHELNNAKELGNAWNGISEAVRKANEQFDSIDARFDRQKTADEKTHENAQKTLALQEKQALANLELSKSAMTEGQYAVNKTGIENFYTGRKATEEQNFENYKLAQKVAKERALMTSSKEHAAEADSIKDLPKTEEEYKAQIKAMEVRADTQGKTYEKFKRRLEQPHLLNELIPGAGRTKREADERARVEKDRDEALKAEQNIRKQIEEKKLAHKRQEELRARASQEAGEGTKMWRELPGDFAANQQAAGFRHDSVLANEHLNTSAMISETTKNGANVGQALKDLHSANVGALQEIYGILRQQDAQIKTLTARKGT